MCLEHGATLAVPEGPEELAFITGAFQGRLWLGINDIENEGWYCTHFLQERHKTGFHNYVMSPISQPAFMIRKYTATEGDQITKNSSEKLDPNKLVAAKHF